MKKSIIVIATVVLAGLISGPATASTRADATPAYNFWAVVCSMSPRCDVATTQPPVFRQRTSKVTRPNPFSQIIPQKQ